MTAERHSLSDNDAPRQRSLLATLLQPKVGIPLLIVVALFAAPFIYRETRVADIPDIGPPFDLEADGFIELEREDNAVFDYRTARVALRELPGTDNDAYDAVRSKGWSEATDSLKAWAESNRAALEAWKGATRKDEFLLHQPRDLNINSLLEEVQHLRSFARAAAVEAARLESEGKFDEAWSLHESVFRSSRHSGSHGCLVERLVGMALHAMAVQDILKWANDPRVTEEQLTTALEIVTELGARTAPLSTALKAEYFSLMNTISQYDPAPTVSGLSGGDASLMRVTMFLQHEPLLSRLILQQIWANLLEHIDKPVADRPPILQGQFGILFDDPATGRPIEPNHLPPEALERFAQRSVLVNLLLPAISQCVIAADRERARQATLIAALAAQVYRRRTGQFPERFEAVVESGILKAVPVDPFSKAREPLHYRRDKEGVTIWSVGDDGADNGGDVREMTGRSRTPDIGYVIPMAEAEE
ncbi:MAG: hypothetical protein IT428_32390 [Planctomycetaceae bacterium]|nr:hypothetical protein [Planctomycetaceae bacterium]